MANATIRKRIKQNGEARYQCIIRIKKNRVVIHSEAKHLAKNRGHINIYPIQRLFSDLTYSKLVVTPGRTFPELFIFANF